MYDRNKEYIQTVHYLLYTVVILFFFIEIYAIAILLINLVEVQ